MNVSALSTSLIMKWKGNSLKKNNNKKEIKPFRNKTCYCEIETHGDYEMCVIVKLSVMK